jgi:hypothetical protein
LLANSVQRESLLAPLGLGSLCWIVSEIDNTPLVPSIDGKVDILPGPLEFCDPAAMRRALARHRLERPDWDPSLL